MRLILALWVALGVARAAIAEPFAYFSELSSDRVSVVDLATFQTKSGIPVGKGPRSVAMSPDGTRVYVANQYSQNITVIDTPTNTVVTTIPVSRNPTHLAINADGSRLYALIHQLGDSFANSHSIAPAPIAVIDTRSNTVINTLTVQSDPRALALDPEGKRLFVSRGTTVDAIDTATGTLLAQIPVSAGDDIVVNPDGTRLFVAVTGGFYRSSVPNEVRVVDLVTYSVIATIPFGDRWPIRLRINSAGTRLYALENTPTSALGSAADLARGAGDIIVIDTTSNTRIKRIEIGTQAEIDLNTSGTKLYVFAINYVTKSMVFDAATGEKLASFDISILNSVPGTFITREPAGPGMLSGLWWKSNESGWGLQLTHRRDVIFAALYIYDAAGKPQWFVASNCKLANPSCGACLTNASCTGSLYHVHGPRFFGAEFNPYSVELTDIGSMKIEFKDQESASLTYSIDRLSRTVPITRMALASATKYHGIDYTDLWWNPQESGWGLGITHQYSVMFLTWYVYDAEGTARWYVASDCKVNAKHNGCTGALYRTTGPAQGPTFDPSKVVTTPAGTVTLSFGGSDTGTMSYTVDGVASNKIITRMGF